MFKDKNMPNEVRIIKKINLFMNLGEILKQEFDPKVGETPKSRLLNQARHNADRHSCYWYLSSQQFKYFL